VAANSILFKVKNGCASRVGEGGMATRVKLELDPETFGRLVQVAVAEYRSADDMAEVILRRALGTWEEGATGYGAAGFLRGRPVAEPLTDRDWEDRDG
jgi:hypothetical protein